MVMNRATVHDIISELRDFEKEIGLPSAPKDRWQFRFSKEYMVVLGRDLQRMVISAKNPEQVIMRYSTN